MLDLQRHLAEEGPAAIENLPPELISDVGKMRCLRPYYEEFVQGWRVKQNLLELKRKTLAMANRKLATAHKNGMRVVARFLPEDFEQLRRQYGPGVNHSKEMLADTLKRHPEMATASAERPPVFFFDATKRNVKFSKNYA